MKETYRIVVNGEQHVGQAAPQTPLLWFLRDQLGLTGTKYGCGIGLCGACTVHVDGVARRSCVLPIGKLAPAAEITTIEGIVARTPEHPVLTAWRRLDVPQCGYCQPGQVMAAIDFLHRNPSPDAATIRRSLLNYCRCGTYPVIAAAIAEAAKRAAADGGDPEPS